MGGIILFCLPKDRAYIGSIDEITEKYKDLNKEFDAQFGQRDLNIGEFGAPIDQGDIQTLDQTKKIRFRIYSLRHRPNLPDENQEYKASVVSYLFDDPVAVEHEDKKVFLPRIHAVQIATPHLTEELRALIDLDIALGKLVNQIYLRNEWTTSKCSHSNYANITPKISPTTNLPEAIMDPYKVLLHAKEHGYDSDKLYYQITK